MARAPRGGWRRRLAGFALAAATADPLVAGEQPARLPDEQVVIAHRGASGHLPEHTLAGYALAHAMGADYIEPDLVMTGDGVLIALHDIHLEATTDVEQRFPDRARDDGRWYAADFTLAEIGTLSVHERTGADGAPVYPERFRGRVDGFGVPTFEAVLALVASLNRTTGCAVGVYPELKRPDFHAAEGLPVEAPFLAVLDAHGYRGRDAPIIVQSFHPDSLERLRFEHETDLRLVQLIADAPVHAPLRTPQGLDAIATYADGIGPAKTLITASDGGLVRQARERGLTVHPYTFRADDVGDGFDSVQAELARFLFDYGVDGVFTDHPEVAATLLETRTRAGRTPACRQTRPG